MHFAIHYTMNHIRFMISPELNVVQDGVQALHHNGIRAKALNPAWFRAQSE
jgi:hypothetical protein